jgi:DNA-binding GntR family transcriptional regulator
MMKTSLRARRKPVSAIETDSKGAPQVIGWVRERIRHGQLVPGQRLVEADIVAATGASRSKVREALQRLESEGLVTLEEFRGASVKKFGPDEIQQIYRARMALEGLAASECALRGGDALKRELSALQQQMDEGAQEGDHGRFARLNDAWHRLIISGSGNEYVAQFLGRLTVPIYRLLFSSFYPAQRIRAANADHRVITAAIVEGRAEDAERAMRDHIRQGLDALTELNAHLEG